MRRRFPVEPWWYALGCPLGVVGMLYFGTLRATVITAVLFLASIVLATLPLTIGMDRWCERYRPGWPFGRE